MKIRMLAFALALAAGQAGALEVGVQGGALATDGTTTQQAPLTAGPTTGDYAVSATATVDDPALLPGFDPVATVNGAFNAAGAEFGQSASGQGSHAAWGTTTATETVTNMTALAQAATLNLTIHGGHLNLDHRGFLSGGYLGIEVFAPGVGTLATGTLLLARDSIAPQSGTTVADGLLAGLNNLALTDDGMFASWRWDRTEVAIDLGVLGVGQSLDLQYRVVTAIGASGGRCNIYGCASPNIELSFVDPPCGACAISRVLELQPIMDAARRPMPLPTLDPPPLDSPFRAPGVPLVPLLGAAPPVPSVPAPPVLALLSLGTLLLLGGRRLRPASAVQ